MTNVILSIKPKYANAIIEGTKSVEFRKTTFKRSGINKVYIYSSHPEKKIIGYFYIEDIFIEHPEKLWEQYGSEGAIKQKDFFDYYKNKKVGYCIKIKKAEKLKKPLDPKTLIQNFTAPQSFVYASEII